MEPYESLASQVAVTAVRYVLLSFVDLSGRRRGRLVPASAIPRVGQDGLRFSGGTIELGLSAADPDVIAIPDASSFVQLPWRRDLGWVAADLHHRGAPFACCGRRILKHMLGKAAASGYTLKHGVECEFFILSLDMLNRSPRPSYNQAGLMRRYDVLTEICGAVEALGWGALKIEQENAHGQFEVNWAYDGALVTADRHHLFKFLVADIGRAYGLAVSFMPQFLRAAAGVGCHAHLSLWRDGRNLFHDDTDPQGMSPTARHFIGGLLDHAADICAITNSTVNSYTRTVSIVGEHGRAYLEAISYGNRTHAIRVPGPGRIEFRMPDMAVNPYLLPAAILSAGLDGMARQSDPGAPLDVNMFGAADPPADLRRLPSTLLLAVRAMEGSALLRREFGDDFVDAYAAAKRAEWDAYAGETHLWEQFTTLDC